MSSTFSVRLILDTVAFNILDPQTVISRVVKIFIFRETTPGGTSLSSLCVRAIFVISSPMGGRGGGVVIPLRHNLWWNNFFRLLSPFVASPRNM